MNNKAIKVKVYEDILGVHHDIKRNAESINHELHLEFRKYIQDDLFVFFSDGGLDKIATTKNIWDKLEFTQDCIRRVSDIMFDREHI